MDYTDYINLRYRPDANDLIAEFRLEPARGVSFKEAAGAVAAESSVGTWTQLTTITDKRLKQIAAEVFSINEKSGIIKIAYPSELFELGNVPQLMSSVAGNVFGMSLLNNLRLEDINLPNSYIRAFRGPKYGIPGIRKMLRVYKRPLLGTIIKPKLGLDEKEHAQVAYQAWLGGCDIVKDDENLSSMKFNKFYSRIAKTINLRDRCEKETGEKKIYMPNITAECDEMLRRAEFAKKVGCEYAMVDVLTVGWSALQKLRNANEGLKLVLHGHRAGHAAITRNPKHGISMLVIAKLCRLIGIDQLHVGAVVGKMEGAKREVQEIGEEIEERIIRPDKKHHILAENWLHIKPMFAVCSGGLHPGKVPALVKAMGPHIIIIQMGGGIHGHPRGTFYGAMAARQAVEATMHGIPLKDYAKYNRELREALDKFGEK
ncbi:MAG: type III ribulose-bisphosphate carboxylase [Candidatus Diapherotrites archaeon]|nr:type III ribulose-bisphosphate carboxylase [Candidatus Diapherotrites archaeon]